MESNTDSKRKLASVQVVDALIKHPNADTLELATILGWQVSVKIGEVKLGQLVVYCEVDSLLPANADWLPPAVKARIESQSKDLKFFRVKTIKQRGELSQGLIVSNLPMVGDLPVGTDLTEKLGVEKWEPNDANLDEPCRVRGEPRVNPYPFPTHLISKTDESAIQSHPKLLKEITGRDYIVTVKHDGSSATYLIDPDNDTFLVCSRNQWRPYDPKDVYWEMAIKYVCTANENRKLTIGSRYDIEQKLRNLRGTGTFAIQGEICGPKIQRNLLGLKENTFYVFNIFELDMKEKLLFGDMLKLCKQNGFPTVEFVEGGNSFNYDLKDLLKLAEGFYPHTKNHREGIVVRTIDHSVSFKVISNAYRLKNDY